MEDQVGELKALQDEGKIRHIGLSEVSVDELEAARKVADIVSVQNRFSLGDRASQALLDHCTAEGIGFIPWRPVADHVDDGALQEVAAAHDATPSQVALAWLLQPLARDGADPRHVDGRAPRGEHRGRRHRADRRRAVGALAGLSAVSVSPANR